MRISLLLINILVFAGTQLAPAGTAEHPEHVERIVDTAKIKREAADASGPLSALLQKWGINHSATRFEALNHGKAIRMRLSSDEWLVFICDQESMVVKGENIQKILDGDKIDDLLPGLPLRVSDIKVLSVKIVKDTPEKTS